MTDMPTIVTESELRALVRLDRELVDVIENAFAALHRGQVVMPPILSMDLPMVNGEVDVKTAYIPGFDGFAVKISPGFFDNPALGLPSLSGLMVLLCARTGRVQSVFLDNGYLTDLRTAAAGAVAARHLAPRMVETAGVIGTGVQARLQLKAAQLVRPFARALVWGRDDASAAQCAVDLERALGIPVEPIARAAELVNRSQLVITTTPARTPLLLAEWLHPRLHITAIGSDQPGKNELDPQALASADLYVADSLAQCETSGELEALLAHGGMTPAPPAQLGEIITGAHAGRASQDQVTICDLTGTGVQDTAIANHVHAAYPDAGHPV